MNDAFLEMSIGNRAVGLTDSKLQPGAVGRQVAKQRLRDVERNARTEQRVIAVQKAVAVRVRRVPRYRIGGAEPRQTLIQSNRRRDDVGARGRWNQKTRRRLQLIVATDIRG